MSAPIDDKNSDVWRGHGTLPGWRHREFLNLAMPNIHKLLAAIDQKFPFARAESWDRVGLQIGDARAEVRSVIIAHEVTDAVLNDAKSHDALVVYHPLLFRPLENLDFKNHTARLAARCISDGLNVIAVHSALDNAPQPHALGDHLAQSLGLDNIGVLRPTGHEPLFKIVVFTPPEALEKVSAALWDAGAGRLGNYERASFRQRGTGTFVPLPGADPYDGEVGKMEEADEWRLEVIVPATQREAVIRAMKEAHPYEEVAYDAYPLHNLADPYGAARSGVLRAALSLDEWALQVRSTLNAPNVRVVRGKETAKKVACVPGSGASYIDAAARAGCDCLVTGDIKHHDALKAQAMGLSLIDATHTATERAAVGMLADALSTLDISVTLCEIDTNPFERI